MGRNFSEAQRREIYVRDEGKCQLCHLDLGIDWHCDHVKPWVRGGRTVISNAQALCKTCNLKKGSKMTTKKDHRKPKSWKEKIDDIQLKLDGLKLRKWQRENWDEYRKNSSRDWMIVASVGGGKTIAALYQALKIALQKYRSKEPSFRIVIVSPSTIIKDNWIGKALEMFDADITGEFSSSGYAGIDNTNDAVGMAVTYQALRTKTNREFVKRLCDKRPVLVIFDEIHHASIDKSFGSSILECFGNAKHRISLSGTPFRHDKEMISFLKYCDDGYVVPDFSYSYREAVRDGVCRPLRFVSIKGSQEWLEDDDALLFPSANRRLAGFDDVVDERDQGRRLKTALSACSDLIREAIERANNDLMLMREVTPDACGMLIAFGIKHAVSMKNLIREITGQEAKLLISDENKSLSAASFVKDFNKSDSPWLVSVRMVSEGVDIPRARVMIYATTVTTRLGCEQAWGRVIRTRWINGELLEESGDYSIVYIAADERLLEHARAIEEAARIAIAEKQEKEGGDRLPPSVWSPFGGEGKTGIQISRGAEFSSDEVDKADKAMRKAGLKGVISEDQFLKIHRAFTQQKTTSTNGSNGAAPEKAKLTIDQQRHFLRQEFNSLKNQIGIAAGGQEWTNKDWGKHTSNLKKIAGVKQIPISEMSMDQLRKLIAAARNLLRKE